MKGTLTETLTKKGLRNVKIDAAIVHHKARKIETKGAIVVVTEGANRMARMNNNASTIEMAPEATANACSFSHLSEFGNKANQE